MKTLLTIALLFSVTLFSQAIYEDGRYVPETDSLVLEKLDQWQDKKFGLLMHWGPYTQRQTGSSWTLCPEDRSWNKRKKGKNPKNYFRYKEEYEEQKKTFNPVKFNPEKWSKAAKAAGMRYVIFTTKHHDGFSMFDSKYTDYKVTDPECAFSSNAKANITKEIFNAFRKDGMWVGAYFSKPDWNHKNYWDPNFPPKDRNVNYDPAIYPEKWQKYVDFTHNQILELLTDYGKVDILWLDGGWVRKKSGKELAIFYNNLYKEGSSGFIKRSMVNQDIKMDELVVKVRKKQPGLIVVDRAVHGKNQNYLTPENRVPKKAILYPWESCIISGKGWSYMPNRPDRKHMSGKKGIQLLVDIVAKGGNLLLNIAPRPDGQWQKKSYDLLEEYSAWMKVNSTAIYGTRPIAPYKEKNICMTQNKKGNVFLFYMAKEGQNKIPSEIVISSISPKKRARIRMLGSKKKLKWVKLETGFKVIIPEKLRNNLPSKYVWTLKIDAIN